MLDKYKIRVNSKAESKEAQELLFELGAVWGQSKTATLNLEPMSFIYFNGSSIYYGHDDENDEYWFQVEESGKEITLPQLKDLVVLHRNDVKDATHKYIGGGAAYKTVDDIAYLWTRMGWEYKGVAHDLVQLHKEDEQGLISGADALRALADGQEVEFKDGMDKWENIKHHMNLDLSMFLTAPDWMKFRLKPSTIITTLSLEIPAPFEPKDGDVVYFIDCDSRQGYSKDVIGQGCDPEWI